MTKHVPTHTSPDSPPAASDWRWRALAGFLWIVPLVSFAVTIITRPGKRTVVPLYQEAVQNWWQRLPLYHGPTGMNYLPHFAVLFGPYEWLGRALGEILWRGTAAAGLAAGLWLFCGEKAGPDRGKTFFLLSLLTLPLCLPALQCGQANAELGAALLLAAWCLRRQHWNTAVGLLWLATCIKPLGLAAIGLAWAAYPQLWWRLALGLPVFIGLPFLFAPPDYAGRQYLGAWENLRQCAEVTEHRFADLNGLLRTFGTALMGKASFAARALAGGALMLVCWRASRREREPHRALIWLGCAAGYLMLFNPMSEENSYVILAPALSLMAWWAYNFSAKPTAWIFAGMVLTMGVLPELLRPLCGNRFALAWHPAMTLVFLAIIAWPQRKLRSEDPPDRNAPPDLRGKPSAAGTAPLPSAGTQP